MATLPMKRSLQVLSCLAALAISGNAFACESPSTPCPLDQEYVGEYATRIAAVDRRSSTGAPLRDIAAIVQQDRYNVNVRRIRQPGDSTDAFFASKANRAQLARAVFRFPQQGDRAAVLNGDRVLLVTVYRRRSDQRLELIFMQSDGTPADDPAASASGGRIPMQFHGKWASSLAICRARQPLQILSIDATGLLQAEGAMSARSVRQLGGNPRRIAISAENSGGGGEWNSEEEFTLSADGKQISWRQINPEATVPSTLYRC